ncbi:MAG: hypothetical protein AB7C97_02200, partial [Oscillospiraceae bacterium]
MNFFAEYLDRMRAEEDLKEGTKVLVRGALAGRGRQTGNGSPTHERKRSAVKRMAVAISSVAACAVLSVAGYAYYNTPINYVSLDINPSVELGINVFGSVVCSEGYNEDGDSILKDNKLRNLSLEEAITALVQKADEQGFILEDGSTVIAITAESDDEETASGLRDTGENGVATALETCNAAAIVYTDCSSLQQRTEAKELGVSPGKYKLIAALQALDPSITVEQYMDAKITEIIARAGEYLSSSTDYDVLNGENAVSFEKMAQAAQNVQTAKGSAEKNRNSEQNMNQGQEDGNKNQEQNGTQNSG